MKLALAILALALLAGTASADTVWNYQGNAIGEQGPIFAPLNPCGCALSGSLTLDAAGQPIAWNFTDGPVTLNQSDSAISLTANYTPTLFGEWFMYISGSDGLFLLTEYYGSQYEATDGGSGGLYVQGNHGAWTDPISSVPEPGTLVLLGLGLTAIIFFPFFSLHNITFVNQAKSSYFNDLSIASELSRTHLGVFAFSGSTSSTSFSFFRLARSGAHSISIPAAKSCARSSIMSFIRSINALRKFATRLSRVSWTSASCPLFSVMAYSMNWRARSSRTSAVFGRINTPPIYPQNPNSGVADVSRKLLLSHQRCQAHKCHISTDLELLGVLA